MQKSLEKETNPSSCTTSQATAGPRRIRLPTWTSYRMAFLSFLKDDGCIFVFTLVTKQRLEVKSKMGFVPNIILDWNSIFFFVQRCHFACRKFNLLAIDGVCRQRTTFSHAQSLHRRFFLLSECAVTHWPPCTCIAQVTKHIVCVSPKNIHTSS